MLKEAGEPDQDKGRKGELGAVGTACSTGIETIGLGELQISKGGGGTTVTGVGIELTMKPAGLGSCVYGTGTGTTLGTVDEGVGASLTINAPIPKVSGALCPSTSHWEGRLILTNHTAAYVIDN